MKTEHVLDNKSVFLFYQIYVESKVASVQYINVVDTVTCMHNTQPLLPQKGPGSLGAHWRLRVYQRVGFSLSLSAVALNFS